METTRDTEAQTIEGLRQAEGGVPGADLGRKHGVSDATVDTLKAKSGGIDISTARRQVGLQDESAHLNRLLADAMPDNAALKDILGKKW